MLVQVCKYTKEHWIICFTWINSMLCELYLNTNKIEQKKKERKLKHRNFVSMISIFVIEKIDNRVVSSKPVYSFFFFFLFLVFLPFSRAAPTAYGGSQARGPIGAVHRPTPEPQQCGIWAASETYTTAHGNAGSLTHWLRPGIKPATSWVLVRFINQCAMTGTPSLLFEPHL